MREQYKHNKVHLIDIDGTVFLKKATLDDVGQPSFAFQGAVEMVNTWFEKGDYIIFWTARPERMREQTTKDLDRYKFRYHELRMDKPWANEIIWYDDKPNQFCQVDPEVGITGPFIPSNEVGPTPGSPEGLPEDFYVTKPNKIIEGKELVHEEYDIPAEVRKEPVWPPKKS